eukprot:6180129-Pleurochrysis_carterae.AAC.1
MPHFCYEGEGASLSLRAVFSVDAERATMAILIRLGWLSSMRRPLRWCCQWLLLRPHSAAVS